MPVVEMLGKPPEPKSRPSIAVWPGEELKTRRRTVAGVYGLLAVTLLLGNAALRLDASNLEVLLRGWRGWDDVGIAIGYWARGEFPLGPYPVTNQFRRNDEHFLDFGRAFSAATAASGIRPAYFWRVLPPEVSFHSDQWFLAQRFDDAGRALLLGLGFRALGGVAPFLLNWLATVFLVPVALWTAWEFEMAGSRIAGVLFLLSLSCSAFVLDLLSLGYSAASFYLLGLLLLVPLAVYASLGQPTLSGLLLRAPAVGALLGLCLLCRSVSVLLLPAYALAFGVGFRRIAPAGTADGSGALGGLFRRRVGPLIALILLLLPYLLLVLHVRGLSRKAAEHLGEDSKAPSQHDIWITIWQGLGDFDRSKSHIYRDKAGEEAVLGAGGSRRLSPESERILRRLVLSDIRNDPVWYAGILARRAWATLTLRKLWPWGPRDGVSIVPASHPNEGVTDNYYTMIAQADFLAVGASSIELPVSILLFPTLILLSACLVPAHSRSYQRDRARHSLPVVACTALAALPAPVFITTASAFETETFVVVHFLALAFLVEAVILGRAGLPKGNS